jgi:hypothetical protein
LLSLAVVPAHAADRLIPLDVALGDVSLNKVSFLMAAIRDLRPQRSGSAPIHTPGAAQVARNSGIMVPAENIKADIGSAPISIGGGSPMIYRVLHRS